MVKPLSIVSADNRKRKEKKNEYCYFYYYFEVASLFVALLHTLQLLTQQTNLSNSLDVNG